MASRATDDRVTLRTCHWCDVSIRRVEILVGPAPGQPVMMWLDVDPHPDGDVLIREDQKFRRLMTDTVGYRRAKRTKPLYRIHGNHTCGRKADR